MNEKRNKKIKKKQCFHALFVAFTFYHELAHLVQKSDYLESFLNERPYVTTKFDLTRHKLEVDADIFSALYLAGHIQQYVIKYFGDNLTSTSMESILEMFCSSILLYILSFQDSDKMYYYECSHPHPVIRLLHVILTITNYIQQSPRLTERKIQIDHIKIFKNSIQVASLIEHLIFESPRAKKFEITVNEELAQISEYVSRLREFKPTNFKLAVDAWNESVGK